MTHEKNSLETFGRLESEVRGYIRSFPTVFERAQGAHLYDEEGREYLDFFAGAGVLNYGHNEPRLKKALLDYIEGDGVTHTLDMASTAKRTFLERFESLVLEPRGMDYKLQFPGPTGTNSVEAALKLARKVTGRHEVIAFTNGFHGMTLGSLAATGNAAKRAGAGVPLGHVTRMPFDDYLAGTDSLAMLRAYLEDSSSGMDKPAAAIVETIQAEGGVNSARFDWLRELAALLEEHGVLLIVDDIQVGCGRTGTFFSFEEAGIEPDIICLSKSLSGYGLPFAMVLLEPEHDVWEPGEHNGTFRGHNPAFVTAAEALTAYWSDDTLTREVERKASVASDALAAIAARHQESGAEVRGRGLILGLAFDDPEVAPAVSEACFERGLIVETSGPKSEVLKLLPPLTLSDDELEKGLEIIGEAVDRVLSGTAEETAAREAETVIAGGGQ